MKSKIIIAVTILILSLTLFSCGIQPEELDMITPLSAAEDFTILPYADITPEPDISLEIRNEIDSNNHDTGFFVYYSAPMTWDWRDFPGHCIHEISSIGYFPMFNFHYIDHVLALHVGLDRVFEWGRMMYYYHDYNNIYCHNPRANVVGFIRYFNITREEMEWLFARSNMFYFTDYNLDIIFSGNDDLIWAYFENPKERADALQNRAMIGKLKDALIAFRNYTVSCKKGENMLYYKA